MAAALAFAAAALILLGWAFDVTLLKSGLPGQRATQPLSAVCFALCALGLGLSTERFVLCRLFTRVCAGMALLVVIATVWQNVHDVDWGLDQFLFSDAVVHEQPGQYLRPGRPAAGTLVGIGLLCLCLFLLKARSAASRGLFVWLATAGMLLAVTVLIAYAYRLPAIYTMGFYAHVGFNSGLTLGLLFYGVLVRRPDLGWMRVLAGATAGAISARRMLLWTAGLLVILAGIVRLGQSTAVYGAGLEVTLLAVGGIGVLLAALWSHARRLNAMDTIRHSVTSDLRAAESQLARAAHDRDVQLARLAHELRNPLAPLRNGVEIIRRISGKNPALARTADLMARQIVQLVRLADNLSGAAGAAAMEGDAEGSAPLKILIADDNADAADTLAALLQVHGHVVLTAPDGRRAIELSESFMPDVILMDVSMPILDGLEATREIRLRSWGAGIRIIALTAGGQDVQRRSTQDAGMDFHLIKPVDPVALAAILRETGRLRPS